MTTAIRTGRGGLERKQARWGLYFVIPAVLFFAVFSYYPIINAFIMSFHRRNLISLAGPVFVGFDNYAAALVSPAFRNSVRATVTFTLGTFVPLVIASLVLAVFLIGQKKSRFWQLVFYSPAVLSSVAAAVIWMAIFQPTGLANQIVNALLFRREAIDMRWISDGNMVQFSTVTVYFWKYIGYFTVLFITGLAKIPRVIYEGAMVDGAGKVRTFFSVTLPLLKPTTVMVSIVAMLQCLKTFSTQYLFFQSGAPRGPIDVITLNIYTTAMRAYNIGMASTMSILLFLAMLILTLVQFRLSRSDDVSY